MNGRVSRNNAKSDINPKLFVYVYIHWNRDFFRLSVSFFEINILFAHVIICQSAVLLARDSRSRLLAKVRQKYATIQMKFFIVFKKTLFKIHLGRWKLTSFNHENLASSGCPFLSDLILFGLFSAHHGERKVAVYVNGVFSSKYIHFHLTWRK